MLNIITAIGSIGTFLMSLFYLVSVSLQLFQMRIAFLPALGFDQVLLIKDKDKMVIKNMNTSLNGNQDFINLYNMGGGAAKNIKIELIYDNTEILEEHFIGILPSKQSNMVPLNKDLIKELDSAIKNNSYGSYFNIRLSYEHNISRKQQVITLNGKIDKFNYYENEDVYELQFIQDD